MNKALLIVCILLFASRLVNGQAGEAPNYANSALLPPTGAGSSKIGNNPVNLFSGNPSISIPIYSYKNNSGLATSISLDYSGGGVQVGESPSSVGLSWFLNAGGIITRTVRGMPDDMATYGFIYASSIPSDWRSNANKYYHDSIDAQQDIFQYNLPGHAGKFFLGKNGQIVTVPMTKIKIIPRFQTASSYYSTLTSFRIVTEDGVKYDFEDVEYTSIGINLSYFGSGYAPTPSAYYGKNYASCFFLSRIISPFYTDTIKFNYTATGISYGFRLPQVTFVKPDGVRKTPTIAPGNGTTSTPKLTSIELPDKSTVSFVYSYDTKYTENGYVLSKIKISDTAFRFGYALGYDTTYSYVENTGHGPQTVNVPIRTILRSVTPYTKNEKQKGYEFGYNSYFPKFDSPADTIQNSRDYWGYFNNIDNGDSLLPQVSPYTWGANRSPDSYWATLGVLTSFKLPTGGSIQYGYEANDHYPYTKQNNSISLSLHTSTSNNITLNQVFNEMHQLVFLLDKSVSRNGASPISGPGTMHVYIKSTDGATTYVSTTLSLTDLYYSGMRTWTFPLSNGTYRLETYLSSGTGVSVSLPSKVNWESRTYNSGVNYNLAGGVRVRAITKFIDDASEGLFEEFKYVTSDGKSSGFLGETPRYDYPYRGIYSNGTDIIDYTAICSEPLGTPGFASIGYSRVEVIKKSAAGNLGKEVTEFTDLKDVASNTFTTTFPYTPQDYKSWGLGIPKKISVYDSSGVLIRKTVNTVQFDVAADLGDNFKSLKLGHSQTNYAGVWNNPGTPLGKTFIGEEYYIKPGLAYITASHDTLYHSNGSSNTSYQYLTYDTNYNVTKIRISYDRNRNLDKESRMYYPYNYILGGGIGKLRDSAIISQLIANESWIIDNGNSSNNRIMGAAMTSFRSVASGAVKPDTIYSFVSNKPVNQANISSFDPSKLNRNTTYFKPQNYFTSYDSKGNLSEIKDLVTGISNSVITDYDQQYVVSKVSNAIQSDLAYTSFESTGSGNWTIGSSARDLTQSLSGKKCYNLANGTVSKSSLNTGINYMLTLWVKSSTGTPTVNGTSVSGSIATQNGWNLYSVSLSGISSITISGSGIVDEVRLHPKHSNMETMSYEPLIGVISETDANNTVVYSEYDKLNRLKVIRDKDKNIIKRFDYSDTTMSISTTPIWVGFSTQCHPYYVAQRDSLYRDVNPYSDSSGYVKALAIPGLDCSCTTSPMYKVVNGVCEQGTWSVTSSIYKKVLVDGFLQWRWVCTRRYCFSDGSTSTYYEDTAQESPCSVGCAVD